MSTLAVLQAPEFKRRWFRSAGAYDATNLDGQKAPTWLFTRIESVLSTQAVLTTTAQLTDQLRKDPEFTQVAERYTGASCNILETS